MSLRRLCTRFGAGVVVLSLALAWPPGPTVTARAQSRAFTFDPGSALQWRAIGPFRAGAVAAIAGDPRRHGVFYAAAHAAGLWKTTDFGASWSPIFDAPPVGDIVAIALSPSDPNIIFTATAPMPRRSSPAGGRLYRSDDGGATWSAVGRDTGLHVARLVVDPSDPERLFASMRGTIGSAPGPGVFRSTNGGVTFERLARTPAGGSGSVVFVHPTRPSIVLMTGLPADAPDSAPAVLLRSADGGNTWLPAGGVSMPVDEITVADLSVAGDAMVLLIASADAAALFRSDDLGANWTPLNTALPADVRGPAHPRLSVSAEGTLMLTAGTLFESHDGGQTFMQGPQPASSRPSDVWTDPTLPGVMMLAGPTGAAITVNAGQTWSRADALPSATVDRISIDAAFPYRVCAALPTITSCAPAHVDDRAHEAADWEDLPRRLAGPVLSDPLDADVVFGGTGFKYDRRTKQLLSVEPTSPAPPRSDSPVPMVFSADGRTLYAGAERVWRTTDDGVVWTAISPELAAPTSPASHISAVTVSTIDARTLWAGLDDGHVYVTRNAGTSWEDVSPSVASVSAVRWIEPSRFDTNSAYVVLSRTGASAAREVGLARTRDGGATWAEIETGIEGAGAIHVVREDPFRRGLLYAGTDRSVFISFDDGERWQPLRLNLPATPIRDLVVRDADLIVGTAGRGVWILDDISPLRQVTADVINAGAFLFRPAQAWRARASAATADAAAVGGAGIGRGAMFTYLLGEAAGDEVTLEVIETTTGDVIRRFSSRPEDGLGPAGSAPLPLGAGIHRVSWDLRYRPPVPGTAGAAPGTAVRPGTYQVRLTVDGRSMRQAIIIRMDPRIHTSTVDLTAQRDLGRALDAARAAVETARAASRPAGRDAALAAVADELNRLALTLQQADVRPAVRLEAAVEAALERTAAALGEAR